MVSEDILIVNQKQKIDMDKEKKVLQENQDKIEFTKIKERKKA
jgi:hypothetical protein